MLIRDPWKPFSNTTYGRCHDQYTDQKSELTLKEIVDHNIELKKRNGEENYFKFFY